MDPLGRTTRRPGGWTPLLIALALVGCINREAGVSLSSQTPPPFSASGDMAVPDRWWTALGDTALDREVEIAFTGSFTLAAALQRLRAARAVVRREASDFWPDVNGISDAVGLIQSDGPDESRYTLGFDTAYQVDLWGEIESRVDAQRLRAAATHADFHAVALTLSAEVARTWYSLIEAQAQLALLAEQIETNETGLELQEARFGLGFIRSADVLRQRQLVESTKQQVVIVQSRIEVLEHRLAVLQGLPPQEATYAVGTQLPTIPPLPETGLPAELLNRRPDVRRDFLAFQAADRDLASAIARLYPRLNLVGSLTTAADDPSDLFRDWFLSVGTQLIAPLLDGGERSAEVDRSAAVLAELFNQYGQTVLIAFQEVEDSLATERLLKERIERLNTQVELARQASVQLREQYLIGDSDYLDVLSAITEEQRLQRERLSARLDLVLVRIALYLALAGSFDPSPQASAPAGGPSQLNFRVSRRR